jgi:hypothetical protein
VITVAKSVDPTASSTITKLMFQMLRRVKLKAKHFQRLLQQ